MRRKAVSKPYPDIPIPPEEYLLFSSQGEPVLRRYRLARISMAVFLPVFTLLSVFHTGIALIFAVAGGIAALFPLRKKYGLKEAVVPFICAIAGIAIGAFLIAPLVTPAKLIQEAYFGFR
jgi:hypothetical protein